MILLRYVFIKERLNGLLTIKYKLHIKTIFYQKEINILCHLYLLTLPLILFNGFLYKNDLIAPYVI
mgnify:CR=1 FL=1